MKKFLPSIILALLAFGSGLAAAATYPTPFANVYGLTAVFLGVAAAIAAVIAVTSNH